jgi:hypothetical protein
VRLDGLMNLRKALPLGVRFLWLPHFQLRYSYNHELSMISKYPASKHSIDEPRSISALVENY